MFSKFASLISNLAGRPIAFGVSVVLILVWALSGPMFHYSDTWQLVINTSTTIITFLMVFVIQNTQNRDNAAVQLKLDELIRAVKGANNKLMSLEDESIEELEKLKESYRAIAQETAKAVTQQNTDAAKGSSATATKSTSANRTGPPAGRKSNN